MFSPQVFYISEHTSAIVTTVPSNAPMSTDFTEVVKEHYFSVCRKSALVTQRRVAVKLTAKGLKYIRKRIKELAENEEMALAEILRGNSVVQFILKLLEESGEMGKLLTSDAKIKLRRYR